LNYGAGIAAKIVKMPYLPSVI